MTDRISVTDELIVEMLRRRAGRATIDGLESETRRALEMAPERSRATDVVARWQPLFAPTMNIVAVAAVVALIVVTALGIGVLNGQDRPGVVPTTSATPAPAPESPSTGGEGLDIPAMPPAGAVLSDATPADLVLRFEPSTPWMTSWLFADGRLITWRHGSRPTGAGDEFIGLIEQRLTPGGVEYLTSEVISTGLFESDLALLWEGAGFLNIDVRNGDQLVQLGWGHRTWGGAWRTAPTATPEQAQALRALTDLLSNQESWPVGSWTDRSERSYVPPTYGICVRGVPNSPDPDYIWSLLPQSAQDLRNEAQLPDRSMGGADNSCTHLTIDDARTLARILVAAGIERQLPTLSGEIWLRYAFEDPGNPERELWIAFGPVLPHGEAVWLGPG
jgi:hypothetical protein